MKFHGLANVLIPPSLARALPSMIGASITRGWLRRKPMMGFALIAILAAGIGNSPAVAEDPDIRPARVRANGFYQ
jgi:hypothetical protein